MFFKGSNHVYSVSDGTQLQIRSSSSQRYWAESKHNPLLAEQKDLYLGIKVLTTALSYQGLFYDCFQWLEITEHMQRFQQGEEGEEKKKGDKWAELNLRMGFESFCCVWEVQWLWKEQG